jgi:hypothetical protein
MDDEMLDDIRLYVGSFIHDLKHAAIKAPGF